jgi:adenine-specific DNA-methyltransferase
MNINIDQTDFDELSQHFDTVLNLDKTTYQSSNDEPTPIPLIREMIATIPETFWVSQNLHILDPCCGNGNFAIPIIQKLLPHHNNNKKKILETILEFNDINEQRLANVRNIFCNNTYKLQISNHDFTTHQFDKKYDLIVANPPYAKLQENGQRASKNHNLIKVFIEKSLSLLKPNGYLLFLTPDNWMSFADRNTLINTITSLQIIHLDIHTAKKYFKKIGSSFTWYLIENTPFYKNMNVTGIWKREEYACSIPSQIRKYIPLLYHPLVQSIMAKTVDNEHIPKFDVKTSSDLHRYTKRDLISEVLNDAHPYKLIHTPKQTVYSSRPHKLQNGYKVFISTTDKYYVFVDNCGMTQSIVFILCENAEIANKWKSLLMHPLYVFLNNICRWGNFNNIRILQSFPVPVIVGDEWTDADVYNCFGITQEEVDYIANHS